MRLTHPRTISLIVLSLLLIVIGLPLLIVVWIITLAPRPTVDYTPALKQHLADARPSEAHDAWPDLLEAIILVDRARVIAAGGPDPGHEAASFFDPAEPDMVRYGAGRPGRAIDFSALMPGYDQASGDDLKRVTRQTSDAYAWLEIHTPPDLIARLANAQWAASSDYDVAPESNIAEILLPHLGHSRHTVEWLSVRMIRAIERGDLMAAAEHHEAILGIARIMANQPVVIARLVAVAMERTPILDLRLLMMDQTLPAETLDFIIERLGRALEMPPLKHNLGAERLFAADAIQRTWTRGGPGGGMYIPSTYGIEGLATHRPRLRQRLANLQGVLAPSRNEMEAIVESLWSSVDALPSMTYADVDAVRNIRTEFDNALAAAAPNLSSIDTFIFEPDVYPNIVEPLLVEQDTAVIRRGVVIMAQIEKHRRRTGHPPQTLADMALPPHSIDEVWLYRRIAPERDELSRPYVIYLAGDDGTNDGGVHGRAYSPRRTPKGTDWVLNWYQLMEDP